MLSLCVHHKLNVSGPSSLQELWCWRSCIMRCSEGHASMGRCVGWWCRRWAGAEGAELPGKVWRLSRSRQVQH